MSLTNLHPWVYAVVIFSCFLAAIVLLTNWRAGRDRIYAGTVVSLGIGIFICLSLSFYSFLVDDVFISLRYARNLANGYGLVFNTDGSTPVEGYTNFLWVLMEALLFRLGAGEAGILHIIKVIGMLFGAGILVISFFLFRLLTFSDRVSATGVLFLSCVPELALWAVGGLETTMYIFWLVAALYMYIIERREKSPHIGSMVFIALMSFTRPEGFFFGLALIAWNLGISIKTLKKAPARARMIIRHTLTGLIILLIIYAGYFLWRYQFYGHLFPNSFYAKKPAYAGHILHRMKQISSFVVQLLPFFAIAMLGYFHFRKKVQGEKLAVGAALLLLILFCFAARNEWMPGYRYELPFVPLLMLFFAAGLARITFGIKTVQPAGYRNRMTTFSTLLFFGVFLIYPFNELRKTGNEFSEQLYRAHVPLGKWLSVHAPENASYAGWDMGAVPYYSGLPKIIDINSEGLLNSNTTRKGYDVDYLLSLNPSFLVLPPNSSYVVPADILAFYRKEEFQQKYEILFTVSFTKEYLLHVYKNRSVILSDIALEEGKYLANKSRIYYD